MSVRMRCVRMKGEDEGCEGCDCRRRPCNAVIS